MQIGDHVTINNRVSSFHGLRGVIVAVPANKFDTPHWMVVLAQGTVPMLFGERELQVYTVDPRPQL